MEENRKRDMWKLVYLTAIVIGGILVGLSSSDNATEYPEIHCKHFFYGYPTGTPATNDLIIRGIYALSSNDERKIADWVAYRLDRDTVAGNVQQSRSWKADPWLADEETLERGDYDARSTVGYDMGHQAPLATFRGRDDWADTNYLSNITPQKSSLNRGAWRSLEGKVRKLAREGNVVYVITGPLFSDDIDMPPLPNANEDHEVPSGYWKIAVVQTGSSVDSIKVASFIFGQDTPAGQKVIDYLTTVDEVEERSGLDFLRELPDNVEEDIESNNYQAWASEKFD